jgi:hypothetical protein
MDIRPVNIINGKPKEQRINPSYLIQPDTILCSVGTMRSGKTNLIINLLTRWYSNYFDNIYLISPSAYTDDKWKAVKISNIHDSYSDALMEDIKDKCKNSVLQDNSVRNLIIIDDMGNNGQVYKNSNSVLNGFIIANRQFNTTFFLNFQQFQAIPARIRSVSPYWILFNTSNKKQLKMMVDELGSDTNKFLDYYKYATKDPFSFLYINFNEGTYYKNFTEKLNID